MMTSTIIWTIAVIAILGLVLAVVLYVVAEKFKVEEDPRIEEVEKVMPGANCGGCGFAGCHAFAEAAVKAVMNAAMSMKPLMRTMRNVRENFAGLHSTSISAM